jgi:DNA-directed RNA polymerase subunit RPC12/RpoP
MYHCARCDKDYSVDEVATIYEDLYEETQVICPNHHVIQIVGAAPAALPVALPVAEPVPVKETWIQCPQCKRGYAIPSLVLIKGFNKTGQPQHGLYCPSYHWIKWCGGGECARLEAKGVLVSRYQTLEDHKNPPAAVSPLVKVLAALTALEREAVLAELGRIVQASNDAAKDAQLGNKVMAALAKKAGTK